MYKLIVIFRKPPDVMAMENRWSQEFVAKAEAMPGLRRVSVSRVVGAPGGTTDLHLVHEFYFDDLTALQEAMTSEAGQLAGQALMGFAGDHVSLAFAEHLEEDR